MYQILNINSNFLSFSPFQTMNSINPIILPEKGFEAKKPYSLFRKQRSFLIKIEEEEKNAIININYY